MEPGIFIVYGNGDLRDVKWDPEFRTFIICETRDPEQLFQSTVNNHCLVKLLHVVFPQKNLLFGFYDFETEVCHEKESIFLLAHFFDYVRPNTTSLKKLSN